MSSVMDAVARLGNSPWLDAPIPPPRPSLAGDHEADVAVVGGGIVGLTTALLLQRSGARVIVLEARRIGAATSGHTTAKLTSLQGRAYSKIASRRADGAADYAAANEAGIDLIERFAEEFSIDCSFERLANYTYAEHESDLSKVEEEREHASAAGLEVRLVEETPLPFSVAGAVVLERQAQFDPVSYLRGIADALDDKGPRVFENSRVEAVTRGGVSTDAGSVTADRVVIATQLPIVDRLGLFARAEPTASYSITVARDVPLDGMYMDASESWSLRSLEHDGTALALVGGQGNRVGAGDPRSSVAALADYAGKRLGAGDPQHVWEAHDYVTEDHLPLVGRVSPTSDRILTVTGLSKWGLALGSACAQMLSRTIADGAQAWPDSFDSRRLPRPRSLPTLAKHTAETATHLVADRLKRASADELAPGEGAVVGSGLQQRAAYRDEGGKLTELSARCTHLGCIVAWNPVTTTWDCPCHGSRFDVHGEVVTGPAIKPLKRIGPAD